MPKTLPILETERLILRPLRDEDAEAVYLEFSHPEVVRHMDPQPPVNSIENAKKLLEWFDSWLQDELGGRWAIILKETNTFIGTGGFHAWDQGHRRAEFGYDLRYEYWGKGYASEAIKPMLQYGFEVMKLHRIEAEANEENIGSQRVLEKAGFSYEGMHRDKIWEKGRFVSLKVYGLLETDG